METKAQANLEVVRRAYDALDRDDDAAFVALCADDVEWVYPADGRLPYGGLWSGHDGIARFFQAHDEAEEILDFRLDEMIADGERVDVHGFFQGRAKPSGTVWETRFVHSLTVRDGLIRRLEDYFDTDAAVHAHES